MATSEETSRPDQDRLQGVSTSTRLLAGALVVILLMAFFLVSLYEGKKEMVPLPINLVGEARDQTVSYLSSRGLEYEDSGAAILVQRDDRDQIVTQLNEAAVITPDQIDFDRLIKDERMFLTKGQQRTRTRVATQNVLGRMISQMTGIQSATVVISVEEGHVGIGRAFIPRTASVTVMTDSGPMTSASVDAVARMVAGSISGLKAGDVSVIDARTGRAMIIGSGGSLVSNLNMEAKLAAENMALARLEDALGYITGIRISVNAVVETREVPREIPSYEAPEITSTQDSPLDPGESSSLISAGMQFLESLTVAISPGSEPAHSTEQIQAGSNPGRIDQRETDPVSQAIEINASIGVPRSYFTALQRQRVELEGSQASNPEALDALIQNTLESIELQVIPLVATGTARGARKGEVSVSVFEDVLVKAEAQVAAPTSWSFMTGYRDWLPAVVLLLLAVVATWMLVMMIRRITDRSNQGAGGFIPAANQQAVGVFGERDDPSDGTTLSGDTSHDPSVRQRELIEKIRLTVKSNPEESAAALRRWIRMETR